MALGPELRVKKVLSREFGVCDAPQTQPTPPMNFSPILRNPVDHVNATVGELLVYKVKDVSTHRLFPVIEYKIDVTTFIKIQHKYKALSGNNALS